jgi:hypothetical protein
VTLICSALGFGGTFLQPGYPRFGQLGQLAGLRWLVHRLTPSIGCAVPDESRVGVGETGGWC